MATNVKFLRGQSANLFAAGKEYHDGYLYMTDDTHKLYVGIQETGAEKASLKRLNQDILFVEKVDDLNIETHKAEQFYYAKAENVLCIYDVTQQKFVQVNPDAGAVAVGFEGAEDGNVLVGARYDAATRQMIFTKGKITAKDIKTTNKITVTTAVGNYAKNQEIAVSDLETILVGMLSKDSDPSATQPSVTITLKKSDTSVSSDTAYEVGTSFKPNFSVSNSLGKYTANGTDQSSGVSVTSTTVTEYGRPGATTNATSSNTSGGFDSFTIGDNTSYYLGVSSSFSDGVVPTTFLGNTNAKCEEVQIKAQTKTNTSKKVTGYRSVFYGYKTSSTMLDMDNITSDQIRALSKAQTMTTSLSTDKMQQMIFAFPTTWGVKSVSAVGEPAPRNIKKLDHTVNVEGANSYEAIAYDVFYCTEGSANGGAEKFTISYSTTA